MPQPHEVFTPGEIPLGEDSVYVARAAVEAALTRCLQRNWCPVVYGEYGVGKTTLVRKYFQEEEEAGRLVYVATAANLDMPHLFEIFLEHLEYSVTTEWSSTNRVVGSGGFDVKVVKAGLEGSHETATRNQLLITSPTDATVIGLINDAALTVVIDEMHMASNEFRAELSTFIKATRVGASRLRLVFVGTSADALLLVSSDPGINRFVKDTHVPLMTDDEARKLISDGFRKLELNVEPEIVTLMVSAAAGAPSILQNLCLDGAESALASGRTELLQADIVTAVQMYIKDNSGRMLRAYYAAIETQGDKRYRKQILHAVADLDHEYATMEDLRAYISTALGEDVPSTALSGPLRSLKTQEYGAILKDVPREGSGDRIQNVTSFTDPMMKSYVRFMRTLDTTELLPEDDARRLARQAEG